MASGHSTCADQFRSRGAGPPQRKPQRAGKDRHGVLALGARAGPTALDAPAVGTARDVRVENALGIGDPGVVGRCCHRTALPSSPRAFQRLSAAGHRCPRTAQRSGRAASQPRRGRDPARLPARPLLHPATRTTCHAPPGSRHPSINQRGRGTDRRSFKISSAHCDPLRDLSNFQRHHHTSSPGPRAPRRGRDDPSKGCGPRSSAAKHPRRGARRPPGRLGTATGRCR